ncbi:MAG TPA: hypothetical protein PKA04_01665 [Marmoricola sp.]|nr:hypothetical protein [Marmoricola sp.]HMY08335.1 hypothetical protein [Marmoricola sp.]
MSGYAETVTAWVEHLRGGGTSSWEQFTAKAGGTDCDSTDHRHHESLPTATQLRLLQLLLPKVDRPDLLTDLITHSPAPGRGLVDIPLTWPSESPIGTPAHAPIDVPEGEVLRQAIGVLAVLLNAASPELAPTPSPAPLPLPWRQRFRAYGAPVTAGVVRRELVAQRHAETNFKSLHIILACPLDQMMGELWQTRVSRGGIIRWRSLWHQAHQRGQLPRPLDIAAVAASLRAQGNDVVIVVGHDSESSHVAAVRHLGRQPRIPVPPLNPAATDARRRINRLVSQTYGADALTQRQAQINAVLRLPDHQRLGAPADLVDWAVEQAHHQVEAITDAGYPVVGELSKLIPSTDESIPRRMHAARTLPVVLDAIIKTWKESPWPNA